MLFDLDDLRPSRGASAPAQMAMEAKVNVKRDNFIVEKKSIICLDRLDSVEMMQNKKGSEIRGSMRQMTSCFDE